VIDVPTDRDTLRASGERFAHELIDARVMLTRHIIPGSTHGFLNRPARPAFHAGITT
jgi:acetyl esterase